MCFVLGIFQEVKDLERIGEFSALLLLFLSLCGVQFLSFPACFGPFPLLFLLYFFSFYVIFFVPFLREGKFIVLKCIFFF